MVKIALDPHMYHAELSVADELRKAADRATPTWSSRRAPTGFSGTATPRPTTS